jgi:2,3-bisphosphoglycerate-dependent phosphoglycerate mutase
MSSDATPQAMASAMRSIEAAFLVDGQGATLAGATEVWLVRHGDCYEGITAADPPLSPLGREQARRLADRIGRLRVDAVYTSPMRRARETAGALAQECAADARVEERLVEVRTELDDGYVQPVEQPAGVLARMRAAVADAVAASPGSRIVMVGHALAIMGYLCDVLRLEYGTLRVLPYYTSVSVVRLLGDRRMVGSLADVAHLER